MSRGRNSSVWVLGSFCWFACGSVDSAPPAYMGIEGMEDGGSEGDPLGGGIAGGSPGAGGGLLDSDGGLAAEPTNSLEAIAAMQETCDTLSPERVHVVGNFRLVGMGNPQAVWDMERPGYPCLSTSGLILLPEQGRLVTTGSVSGVYEHVFDKPIRSSSGYTDIEESPDVVLVSEDVCMTISSIRAYPGRSDITVSCARGGPPGGVIGEPGAPPPPLVSVPGRLVAFGLNGFALTLEAPGKYTYGDATTKSSLTVPSTETTLTARSSGEGILLATIDSSSDVTKLRFFSPDGSVAERGEYPAPDEPIDDPLARSRLDAEGALYDVTVRNGTQTVIKRTPNGEGEQIVFQRSDPTRAYGLQIRTIDILQLVTGP